MATRAPGAVTTEVYLSLVRSLFGNRRTLFVSLGLQTGCLLLVWWQSGLPVYLCLAAAFMIVGLYRTATLAWFDRADCSLLTPATLARWERWYLSGAISSTCILGLAAGYAVATSHGSFAELVCISVAMVTVVSVVGRNYGSRKAVILQSLSLSLPIVIASLVVGDPAMIILSLLLMGLVLATLRMAAGIRDVLSRNVHASRAVSLIADSFDTALNNMTHGLLMLDRYNRIQVINRKACELLQLGEHYRLKNCDLDVVLKFGVRHAIADGSMPDLIQKQLRQLVGGSVARAVLHFSEDLVLEFSASHQAGGGVVLIFEDVTGRIHSERKILHMVRYDSLTGLPNRSYFADLVKERAGVLPPEAETGILLLDINDFKHVNDMKGHATGDRLLAAVADRLSTLAGNDVLLAHLLGDRFVFLFAPRDGRVDEAMRDVHAKAAGSYDVDGTTFRITMNAGGVILPAGQLCVEDWQIKADLALYDSKSRGKGTLALFAEEMDARYLERQRLKVDLRDAVENWRLSALYQPMYVPDGSQLSCCEALARWTHPEKGPIAPNIFIEIAEEMGIVSDITRFMIDRACRDCVDWPEHISVSVNLSEHDLRNCDIVRTVEAALADSGLSPSRLHLEVTESSLIEELSTVSLLLGDLRALGVSIAIDDFGTGFSSLSYLDRLPVDIVKIDRSFVRDITTDARRFKLLRGIVTLSRQLDLEIVLEGVETEAQLERIREYRCADLIQGYVFSTPVSTDRISVLSDRAQALRSRSGQSKVA
ncbi:EAL domain-containing protein [Rhizobium sp. RU36D]|uniref:putative bifunctional diguanylate cyclase/phosphodiesterase n=1 Tax=Rhizobium sp. RU36D TaxID=1907415 RepID=UPI0009D8EA21|nr:EAL domain-containing protein [Rhizobium sp. RU36D]SMC43116.1 diguanylate cyclase/phosphodiesterase [Rhizobium sp. RU36D]